MTTSILSEHFTLRKLAEGVYAVIAKDTGAGGSNAGLVDLGDQTLVFDSFENPQAAEDLWKASVQLTRRTPSIVVISHMHPDHWGGLQVFAECTILATTATRQAMHPFVEDMLADKQDPSRLEKDLREAEERLEAEIDQGKRAYLRNSIARKRFTLKALSNLQPTIPNQTFEGKIIFHGKLRSVELIATGKGHTASDCILNLPQDRVAFIGDIGFFQSQPFMWHSSPPDWIALLEHLATWEVDTFVPGHGPLGDKSDLELVARYIRALEDMVLKVVQAGGSMDDALRQTLPAPFDAWQALGGRFDANVRSSYARHWGLP